MSRPTLYLGTDPGRHGAAALVTPKGDPLAAWAWTPVVDGTRMRAVDRQRRAPLDIANLDATGLTDPFSIGREVGLRAASAARADRRAGATRIVSGVEGLFVGRASGSSAPDTLTLAEWIGEYRAGLRAALAGDAWIKLAEVPPDQRPRAQTWRARQLGKGWGTADRVLAEAHAITVAGALALGFPPEAWTKGERGAVSEAFFIARHIATVMP